MAEREDQIKWKIYKQHYINIAKKSLQGEISNKEIDEFLEAKEQVQEKVGLPILDSKGKTQKVEARGVILPIDNSLGNQAHHLIFHNLEDHAIWKKAKMTINDAENLLNLPDKSASYLMKNYPGATHEGPHSRIIYEKIKKQLDFICEQNNSEDPEFYKAAILKVINEEEILCKTNKIYLNKTHVEEHIRINNIIKPIKDTILSLLVTSALALGGSGLNSKYNGVRPHPLVDPQMNAMVYGRRRDNLESHTPQLPFKAAFMDLNSNKSYNKKSESRSNLSLSLGNQFNKSAPIQKSGLKPGTANSSVPNSKPPYFRSSTPIPKESRSTVRQNRPFSAVSQPNIRHTINSQSIQSPKLNVSRQKIDIPKPRPHYANANSNSFVKPTYQPTSKTSNSSAPKSYTPAYSSYNASSQSLKSSASNQASKSQTSNSKNIQTSQRNYAPSPRLNQSISRPNYSRTTDMPRTRPFQNQTATTRPQSATNSSQNLSAQRTQQTANARASEQARQQARESARQLSMQQARQAAEQLRNQQRERQRQEQQKIRQQQAEQRAREFREQQNRLRQQQQAEQTRQRQAAQQQAQREQQRRVNQQIQANRSAEAARKK